MDERKVVLHFYLTDEAALADTTSQIKTRLSEFQPRARPEKPRVIGGGVGEVAAAIGVVVLLVRGSRELVAEVRTLIQEVQGLARDVQALRDVEIEVGAKRIPVPSGELTDAQILSLVGE